MMNLDLSLRFLLPRLHTRLLLAIPFCAALACSGQDKPAADVLVLTNGDSIHGKFVNETSGKVNFHSDGLGDLSVPWEKIKELRTSDKFAVLDKTVKMHGKQNKGQVPSGSIEVANQAVTVSSESGPAVAPIPVKNAEYIVDQATLDKEMNHEPGFLAGWNGAATAGATLVTATQSQYTFSGSIGLVRTVPTVTWINPRNRTSADFTASYGKITQPAYVSAGVLVPETVTKSSIYHADAERDEYLSQRVFALVETAFDHNFAQNLQLQQIYGGGLGWTVIKTPNQEADLKATMQYERQQFIDGAAGTNQNLIGSTFAATYLLHMKLLTYIQGLQFIPSYNTPRDYSANETNTLAFPAYKNLGFSVGTMDSYLNNSPPSEPPTKRNSFQFIMGLTYAIKSKY